MKSKVTIEPMYSPYPSFESLSSKQKETYNNVKENLNNFTYIDVQSSDSYIMLFMNELVGELLSENHPCEYYVKRIQFIKENYQASFLQDYTSMWLGDVYFYFNEFHNAIESWVAGLRPEKIWTLLSSKILSLKLTEDLQIGAHEALSYKKNITKYGKSHMELMIKYVDKVIEQDYLDGLISSKFFLESSNQIMEQPCLFTGCVFGYDINEKYKSRKDSRKEYNIESLTNLTSYISNVSRRAENALREDLDMPRVGEGWISETELYYKIKKHFSQYTVIQHYSEDWLGKQHLDVYIKELNIGIEYHGLQHFQPVEFFGGQKTFIENQKRDRNKVQKCKKNSTKLIVVTEGYDFDDLVMEIKSKKHKQDFQRNKEGKT